MLLKTKVNPSSIPLTNDLFVKFALSGDDQDSDYLRRNIIRYFTSISSHHIQVLNPELLPSTYLNKDMILDIRLKDEQERYFNIEIQVSDLSKNQYQRFQVYQARSLSMQLDAGEGYERLEPVFQLVFLTTAPKDKECLYEIYTLKNEANQQLQHNLIHIIFVYMPNINKVIKTKPFDQMEVAEKFVYILVNNLNDAILKEGSRVVEIMEKKKAMFLSDSELSYAAYQRHVMHWANTMDLKDAEARGRELGIEEGKFIGQMDGKREAYVAYVKARYQEDISDYLEQLDDSKWDILENNIYLVNTLEELKELLK